MLFMCPSTEISMQQANCSRSALVPQYQLAVLECADALHQEWADLHGNCITREQR